MGTFLTREIALFRNALAEDGKALLTEKQKKKKKRKNRRRKKRASRLSFFLVLVLSLALSLALSRLFQEIFITFFRYRSRTQLYSFAETRGKGEKDNNTTKKTVSCANTSS